MNSVASLSALFSSSFLAATLLPGGSELVLYAFLQRPGGDVWAALAVATLGNTLGGMTSYLVGRLIPQHKPLTGIAALRRHGAPALLLSWVPIIGDALCVASGWMPHERMARRIVHGAGQVRPLCRYRRIRGVITRIHDGIVFAQAGRAR